MLITVACAGTGLRGETARSAERWRSPVPGTWSGTLQRARALRQEAPGAGLQWWGCSEPDRFPGPMRLRPRSLLFREATYRAPRVFRCAQCHRQTTIGRECDRGHRYCSEECAAQRRRERMREAGRRYQRSEPGRLRHQERQRRYRQRPLQAHSAVVVPLVVPSSPSPGAPPSQGNVRTDLLLQPGSPAAPAPRCCDFCGIVCSSFTRLDSLRSRKWRWRPAFGSSRRLMKRMNR